MTHHHLGLHSSDGFKYNAYDDQYRSTAHGDVHSRNCHMEQNWEDSDDTEAYSADKSNLGKYSLNEIAGRLTGSYTGDTAVVLTEVVCDLNRIVLH